MNSVVPAQASPCALPSVRRVTVPVYPDRTQSATFSYAYQYYPPKRRGAPTIVVIPGGPGVGLIENWSESGLADFGLPRDAGLIFLDPRTVGCNYGDERKFPDDALTSEYLALDLLAALAQEKISSFILYGHSYGSVLATVAAGLAERQARPALAVVLTGVIGHAVKGWQTSVYGGLVQEWDRLFPQLPSNVRRLFKSGKPPLGWSEETWSDVIENGLYLARVYRHGRLIHPLAEGLRLSLSQEDKARQLLSEFLADAKTSKDGAAKWGQRLFEVIDCAELTDSEPTQTLRKGELVMTGDECAKRPKLIRPYDCRNYQTSSPVFYFAGTSEAVTFYSQALDHFQEYQKSERFFVSIKGGGHNRLGLYFPDCKESLWRAMEKGGTGLQEALHRCKATNLMCAGGACDQEPLFHYLPAQH